MKNAFLYLSVIWLGTQTTLLRAQAPMPGTAVYQQAGAISVLASPAGQFTVSAPAGVGGFVPAGVTGSSFSAIEQSHSLQVLGDGTRIERTTTTKVYRDSLGRTRSESGDPSASVTIQDPVAGVTIFLDPSTRVARKMPGPNVAGVRAKVLMARGGEPPRAGSLNTTETLEVRTAPEGTTASLAYLPDRAVTDLGSGSINGVLAEGKRTTLTIATGEIGNDRPIQVVSESWYSGELQMNVKSSNSDPRFGDTSFEMTAISRGEPDPGLFQVPADYTVSDFAAPAARKVVRLKE